MPTQLDNNNVFNNGHCPHDSVQISAGIALLRRPLGAVLESATAAVKSREGAGPISLNVESGEGDVIFRVADSGPGLGTESEPDLIFLSTVTIKRCGHGLGLGLTVGLTIAQAHGSDL